MSTTLETPLPQVADSPETLADVISRLGDIPLDRIRWTPRPGTATLEDAVQVKHCELIDGVLVEKAMGQFEGRIAQVLAWYLELWMATVKIGFVIGEGALTRLQTGNMRIPDIYIVRWERVPDRVVPTDAVTTIAPHVAVEVLSKSNTKREIERKRTELFESGTEQFWVIDPRKETVEIWDAQGSLSTLMKADTLNGGRSLPGFSLPVEEIFAAGHRGQIDLAIARKFLENT